MNPRFKRGDVAWLYLPLRDRPRTEQMLYRVVLRSLDAFSHSPSSAWLVTWLYEYTQGSTSVRSVPESRLYEALWTFTGYVKRPAV